jgi:hypothetical protein
LYKVVQVLLTQHLFFKIMQLSTGNTFPWNTVVFSIRLISLSYMLIFNQLLFITKLFRIYTLRDSAFWFSNYNLAPATPNIYHCSAHIQYSIYRCTSPTPSSGKTQNKAWLIINPAIRWLAALIEASSAVRYNYCSMDLLQAWAW